MKYYTYCLLLMLIVGFLIAPSCAFANDNSYAPETVSVFSEHVDSSLDNLNPMVKGSSGGKGVSSSSKKIKSHDDDGNDTDDGSGGNSWIWIILIVLIILIGIVCVWYFFLRNR